MSDWNADQYLLFEKERSQPAIDLLNKVGLSDPKRIVDIGCGPGNSTKILKDRYPNAEIMGVDSSCDMIQNARNDIPDTDFIECDIGKDISKIGDGFDLVFSNACIQWIPDHRSLIPKLFNILSKEGVLAVQIPANEEEPLFRMIDDMTSDSKWEQGTIERRMNRTLTPSEYYEILSGMTDEIIIWETTYYHAMDDHRSLIECAKGTRLRPFMEAISDNNKELFESELLMRIESEYPRLGDGKVILPFRRLFFIAGHP